MADYNLSEFAIDVAKAVSVLGVLGLSWKIAVWVVELVM